jgi:hypothetical protein
MKQIILGVGVLFALFSLKLHAADSTWLLCDNKNFVVNSLEHRNGSAGRTTSIHFILGTNLYVGELLDTDSGVVTLWGTPTDQNDYTGEVIIDYTKKTMLLKGVLKIAGDNFNIDTKLKCKEKSVKL